SPKKRFGMISSVVPADRDRNVHSEYDYDENRGGLKQVISKSDKGAIVQQLHYEYDSAGNPIQIRIKG
ncbi:hypothetical protein, partial [Paenibacillus apiarius]